MSPLAQTCPDRESERDELTIKGCGGWTAQGNEGEACLTFRKERREDRRVSLNYLKMEWENFKGGEKKGRARRIKSSKWRDCRRVVGFPYLSFKNFLCCFSLTDTSCLFWRTPGCGACQGLSNMDVPIVWIVIIHWWSDLLRNASQYLQVFSIPYEYPINVVLSCDTLWSWVYLNALASISVDKISATTLCCITHKTLYNMLCQCLATLDSFYPKQ